MKQKDNRNGVPLKTDYEQLVVEREMFKNQAERYCNELNQRANHMVQKMDDLETLKNDYTRAIQHITRLENKYINKLKTEQITIR